ncbi:MAG: hypothetical protein GY861_15140 [bacterium]|nr:hypothetical protein [bacterium]
MSKEEQVIIQGGLIIGGMNYAESADELTEIHMHSPVPMRALPNHLPLQNSSSSTSWIRSPIPPASPARADELVEGSFPIDFDSETTIGYGVGTIRSY